MKIIFEASHRNQEPIVDVVNRLATLFQEEGLIRSNTSIVTYKFPCPFISVPAGRVNHVLEAGYGIVDPRRLSGAVALEDMGFLAEVEPDHRTVRSRRPFQFRHGSFSVSINSRRVNAQVAERVRRGLVGR